MNRTVDCADERLQKGKNCLLACGIPRPVSLVYVTDASVSLLNLFKYFDCTVQHKAEQILFCQNKGE